MRRHRSVDPLDLVVASIAKGDAAALDQLYDATSDVVLELAQRILGESFEAEEVVLDVYQRAWTRAEGFDPRRGSVKSWLVTMTRSRAIDVVRSLRSRRQKEASLSPKLDAEPPAVDAMEGPLPVLLSGERSDLLAAALASLNPNQRAAIEGTFMDGLSHERVARALGQPLGTVKGQIRRGLRRLRQALERHEMDQ